MNWLLPGCLEDKWMSIYPPAVFLVKLVLYRESVTYRIRFLSGGGTWKVTRLQFHITW